MKGSPSPYIGARGFEVSFYLADPYTYQNQEQGPQTLGVGTTNVYNAGKSPAAPVINMTITHPGTVTIQSQPGAFEIYANLTGTYSVDSYNRFVTRNTANYHYRWDGVFPQIAPGQTSLFLSVTHGSVSNVTARWFARD
jgi:phage-related protein